MTNSRDLFFFKPSRPKDDCLFLPAHRHLSNLQQSESIDDHWQGFKRQLQHTHTRILNYILHTIIGCEDRKQRDMSKPREMTHFMDFWSKINLENSVQLYQT